MTRVDFPALAPLLVANGYLPVPITPGTKACHERDWRNFRVNGADLSRFAGFGTGQLLGQVVAPDIDVLHPEAAEELARLCEVMLGAAPRRVGLAPKVLLLYRTQEPFCKLVTRTFTIEGYGERNRVEVLAEGQMAVAYAVHPDTGRPYTWSADNEPLAINVNDLAEVDASRVQAYLDAADAVLARYGTAKVTNGGGAGNASDGGDGGGAAGGDGERVDVEALVEGIRSGAVGWEDGCTRLVGVLIRKKLSGDAVVELFARRLTRVGWTVEQTEASLRKIHRSLTKAEERKTGADLLEGLVERTKKDPSAPLEDDVRAALAAMRESKPAEWVRLRQALKDAGCPVRELDKALDRDRRRGGGEGAAEKPLSQGELLRKLAAEAMPFHNEGGDEFADVIINGHRETWPIHSRGLTQWLGHQFYQATDGDAPSTDAMQRALSTLEMRANSDGPERRVHVRVAAGADGCNYLDLCDERWRAVRIGPDGWDIVERPPVRFRRSGDMKPLPEPAVGADPKEALDLLRKFLNPKDEGNLVRALAWMMAALRDAGPYTIMDLLGDYGSAKSTFVRRVTSLLDPNDAEAGGVPRDDHSLAIHGSVQRLLIFDNVSTMPPWLSDMLCRITTGEGFRTRKYYSDNEQRVFKLKQPVLISGINSVLTRTDVLSRVLTVELKSIPEEARLDEDELDPVFKAACPLILGAMLDAMAHGLKRLPDVKLKRKPRMALFAKWCAAWETYFWPEGGVVLPAYQDSLDAAAQYTLATNPLAIALSTWFNGRRAPEPWEGTATQLLSILESGGGDIERIPAGKVLNDPKKWPPDGARLSRMLRHLTQLLAASGIAVELGDRVGHDRRREITISRAAPTGRFA